MLDEKQIVEFKEAFSFIDRNADGLIDREDLREILTSLSKDEKEVEEMIPNGPINFTTFTTILSASLHSLDSHTDLMNAFHVFDPNRTGHLDLEEFKKYMTQEGPNPLSVEEFNAFTRGKSDYRELFSLI